MFRGWADPHQYLIICYSFGGDGDDGAPTLSVTELCKDTPAL